MKRIAILGSTGSIGVSALKVIESLGGGYRVQGIAARSNLGLFRRQMDRHEPAAVALFDPEAHSALAARLRGAARLLPPGVPGLVEMAAMPETDLVLTAVVGGVGLAPLLGAIKAGKTIALANKEPIVMAGARLMEEARRWEASIIPVDSEPSAIFQCLQGAAKRRPGASYGDLVRRVILTASGGPFYRRRGSLSSVTPQEALAHPNWKMGPKITVDSATLMNKGFEAIEIMNLFGLSVSQIEIVIHPQSIVHSAVEFKDGSVLAQMSKPDMSFPIQYAFTHPERAGTLPAEPLDFRRLGSLDFSAPDLRRFPCLGLALDAAKTGGSMPAVLSAADEVAVSAFLEGRLSFTDIPKVLESTMSAHRPMPRPTISELVETDAWAREKAQELAQGRSRRKR